MLSMGGSISQGIQLLAARGSLTVASMSSAASAAFSASVAAVISFFALEISAVLGGLF